MLIKFFNEIYTFNLSSSKLISFILGFSDESLTKILSFFFLIYIQPYKYSFFQQLNNTYPEHVPNAPYCCIGWSRTETSISNKIKLLLTRHEQ
jgi:hypothetical protein